jgi:hypothetical protein
VPDETKAREDRLAEKVGIKTPRPQVSAPARHDVEDWAPPRRSTSAVDLPVKVASRATSLGVDVARRAIGAGLGVAGGVTNRARGLLGRRF